MTARSHDLGTGGSPPLEQLIFLLEDDPAAARVLQGGLRGAGHRVEAFETQEAVLARISASDRGCLLVGVRAPGLDRLELQRALRARRAFLPVIFMSSHADVRTAVAAMKQGALDFLCKPIAPGELLAVVRHALRWDAETAAARAASERARGLWEELSPRERDVCRLCAKGLINKQIAATLGTAEATVQAQRARALQKLHVSSMAELVRLMEHVSA